MVMTGWEPVEGIGLDSAETAATELNAMSAAITTCFSTVILLRKWAFAETTPPRALAGVFDPFRPRVRSN
jgi:hypothetical protein